MVNQNESTRMQLNFNKQNLTWVLVLGTGLSFNSISLNAQESVSQDASDTPAESAPSSSATQAQPSTFDLFELRVKGNTKLEKNQLERTLYPFLGPKKSIDNVDLARTALEDLYRTQGYQTVSVDIPEQDVKNGIVYLQVVEGKVSRLKVKDSRYFSMGAIKAGVPELAEGNVPHFPTMQKQLAALTSESLDRKIQPVLRAGDTPGTLEVDLKVKDELPFHGRVELNGRNTSTTSRLRLVSSMHYDNLWQAMHSASFMYQVSPENSDQVDVMAGTYALPLFDTGMRLAMYGVKSSSASVASAGTTTVLGNGDIFGARLIKTLSSIGNYSHSFTQGIDYKSFKEDLNINSSSPTTIHTPIEYLPMLTQYSGSLKSEQSFTSFDLALKYSIRGFGNYQAQFENKRYLAKANYLYLTTDIKNQYDISNGMQVKTHVTGQVSDSPLISNEQYSLGGALNVRGYFETQALADSGVFGSMELHSPNLGELDSEYLNNLKLFTYVDAGQGWVQSALKGNKSAYSLAAGGAGFNFHIKKYLLAAFDVGFPFISLAPVKAGEPRLNFNVATEF